MNKPELLAPAGNLQKLKLAFYFGADAVYAGGKSFSLRTFADNFTEQELAEIRLCGRSVPHYDALRRAAHENGHAKDFLDKLARLRDFACDQPVYRLLWQIYDETGALAVYGALPNGAQRQKNLLSFFERARAYESQGFRGLFGFNRLLRGMLETGQDFEAVKADTGVGAVRLMSIHKSKGLEFPIVVLADCAKRFNEQEMKEPVLVHSELGFGAKVRDMERGVQYPSMERQAIAARIRREMVSEELRILYVALTRAKEKLIITAASAMLDRDLEKWARLAAMDRLPDYGMAKVRTPLAWILAPLLRHPAAECLRYERKAAELGYADLQLLGLGRNGHIGFNEPDDTFGTITHCVNLTESTIDANKRFFASADDVPKQAYTMGIGTIMKAKKILLIVSGEDKADALAKAVHGPVTPSLPASILQLHSDVVVVADQAACSKMPK